MLFVSSILIALTAAFYYHIKKLPHSRITFVLLLIWDWLVDYGKSFLGPYAEEAMPFLTSVFLFILTSNWLGDILSPIFRSLDFPFETPTANISVTAGLAVAMLLWIHIWFIKRFGIKTYLKIYFEPMWLLFPLNILEHITRVASLALRLYGNISGEHLVIAILVLLAPFVLPVPMIALSMFIGFIQAYIFFTMGLSYLGAMIEEGGVDHG